MLARCHFLLPCLHFSLFSESVGFQHAIHDLWELPAGLIYIIDATFEAFDLNSSIIAI